ncbi:ParB/RepB/Spo0J family partition protein [Corynebacterium suicordis]|nr:ParB family chromosome partitioning protein [Corynebacterium suicordis]
MATSNNRNSPQSPSAAKSVASKPGMPAASAVSNARKGGLGRGLGALIPSGNARPSLGNGAADVILGGNTASGRNAQKKPASPATLSDSDVDASSSNRQRDVTLPGAGVRDVAVGETRKSVSEPKNGSKATESPAGDDFGATYREIPLSEVRTNAKQPRTVFDEQALAELEHSIREFGLMQPIVVRELPDGSTRYELIMGERRLRASKRAGLTEIPAIIRQTEDQEMLRDALLENIHRVQLNPLEEAAAYQQLLEEFAVTQSELAARIGRSRPRVTNMLRLLQLPVPVQRRVAAGVLSSGHARALLGIKGGAELMESLATRVVAEGLSVRATEEAVTLLNREFEEGADQASKKRQGAKPALPSHVSHWADDISNALDTKVTVQMGKKKGKIVVEFGDPDDFERISEILKVES